MQRNVRLKSRTGFKKPSKQMKKSGFKVKPRKPMKKKGRRAKAWDTARAKLDRQHRKADIKSFCWFDFIEHVCSGPLDNCHSKKRGKMVGDDIYAVARGCRTVHNILDGVMMYKPTGQEPYRFNHEQMEAAVLEAIERVGA